MANNSTPRLKVYRLDNTYTQAGDNDIQQMSNDELLPVVVKNLNPFDTEEMVGVRARQDSRLVVIDSVWSCCVLDVGTVGNHIETVEPVCCDGWVLGKGNIQVFVWRGEGEPTEFDGTLESTLATKGDNANYTDSAYLTDQWAQLDRRFWDLSVETKKTFVLDGDSEPFLERLMLQKPSSGSYEIHDLDWITFRLGNMLTNSDRFFPSNSSLLPIISSGNGACSGKIAIRYRKYHELSSSDSSLSSEYAGVPFGDVYNGNKNGRCICKNTGEKVNILESDDIIDNTKMNFYEGNYLFRRRIYPFRVKVLHEGVYDDSVLVENPGLSSEFACDALMYNGRAVVHSELSWFMDDIMKPVVFERINIRENNADRKIFRQLSKKQVTVQYQNTVAEGDHYIVTLNPSYYSTGVGNEHVYPKELFLVYNYVDDSLGNMFDFNYDYMMWEGNYPNGIGYGHANNGRLSTVPTSPFGVSLRREKIAMLEDAGRDPSTDLLLVKNGNTVSFEIPHDSTTLANAFSYGVDAVENAEKRRINDGILNIDIGKGIRIYVDGKRICALDGSPSPVPDVSINGVNGYTVSYSSNVVTISHSDASALEEITEVMMSYYETHPISFAEDNGVNPYCIGYRIPCYEKVKSSTLFVSSFSNWLRGHVNNDLDVFYGNRLYSGTEVKGTSVTDYHDIYPEYMKDGWYAMYSEGAVEFNEDKTEQNYFDVMNYGVFDANSSPEQTDWNYVAGTEFLPNYWATARKLTLQYKKVRYNVAHLDGIYSVMRGRMTNYSNKNGLSRYALLEDDNFSDSVGRRWVRKEDSTVRRMFEDGRDELPKIVRGTGAVETKLLKSFILSDGQYGYVDTSSDRIMTFAVKGDSEAGLYFSSTSKNVDDDDIVSDSPPNSDYTVVRAKVHAITVNGKSVSCLALGVETEPGIVEWVLLPDLDDAYLGSLSTDGETYNGVGIESVQSNLVTIDALTKTYWNGEDMPSSQSEVHDLVQVGLEEVDSVTNNYHTAPFTNGTESMLRRYRYHDKDNEATWGYDVFFEVLSYRYNDVRPTDEYKGPGETTPKYVEIIAYRVLTK